MPLLPESYPKLRAKSSALTPTTNSLGTHSSDLRICEPMPASIANPNAHRATSSSELQLQISSALILLICEPKLAAIANPNHKERQAAN
eukprot:4532184-Amphidinium_carterae.1